MVQKSVHIKNMIEQMIDRRQLTVGQQLPSELKMAEKFGVSRETFRAAVRLLESEGRLLVKHGVGTFIIQPPPSIPSSLEKLASIGTMIRSAGLQEEERNESVRREQCSNQEWCRLLGLEEEEPVVILERMRIVNGEPSVYSVNILPYSIVGDTLAEEEFKGSLFQHLERRCSTVVTRAHTEIKVPLHIDPHCQKLLIHPETTVLQLNQLHYDESNRPVLYSLDYMRNDIFQFWVQRTRE
ncbi:GntR family transcriptional regulator [Paenibacillus sp. TRM 82003]|nr:GntR family transcriptional regulator [Paenibacillus sp. TRM 82003]